LLEDACRQKGEEFGMATRQLEQFVVLRKIIDGKRADFDGFLSNLGFAKVGAPPPRARIMSGASPVPAPAPVSDQEDGAGIVDSDQEDGGGIGDSEAVTMLVVHSSQHRNCLPGCLTFLCRMWSVCGLRYRQFH